MMSLRDLIRQGLSLLLLDTILLGSSRTVTAQLTFDSTSCVNLLPAGSTVAAQSATAPFTIDVLPSGYISSQPLNLFIEYNNRNGEAPVFFGLIIQARVVGTTTPIGSWTSFSPDYQTLTCNSHTTGTLTTVSGTTSKTLPSIFTWRAPDGNVGNVVFVVSIVFQGGVYWAAVSSNSVGPVTNLPPDVTCPSTSEISVTALNDGTTSAIVTWPSPTCTNLNTMASASVTCERMSGSVFIEGITPVICSCSIDTNDGTQQDVCLISVSVPTTQTLANECLVSSTCGTNEVCIDQLRGSVCYLVAATIEVTNVPSDITAISSDGSAQQVTWDEPVAIIGSTIPFSSRTFAPGSSFNVSQTPVTYTWTIAGQTVSRSFTVNVVLQGTLGVKVFIIPVPTGRAPSGAAEVAVSWTGPFVVTSAGAVIEPASTSFSSGSTFPIGTTIVEYVYEIPSFGAASVFFPVTVSGVSA